MTAPSDKATTFLAMASFATPFWITLLKDVSEAAALLMPILGAIWLIIQITHKIYTIWKGTEEFFPKDDD
jgi:hypothetical protein